MSLYDYEQGEKKISGILNSKTKIEETETIPKSYEEFTYENGIRSWVGALFVDVRDSSDYFKNNNADKVARVIRAFTGEIITILSNNEYYRQIGIRGDCVYAIYTASKKEKLYTIVQNATMINTFQKMFNKLLEKNGFETFSIGIGLGCGKDLIVKAGKEGSGINDLIWIGDAVVNASNLSSIGSKNGFKSIVMDSFFYSRVKNLKANKKKTYGDLFKEKYSAELKMKVYHGNVVNTDFGNWIEEHL